MVLVVGGNVAVRAEEIVLEEAPGHASSAPNLFAAEIAALSHEGPLVRVALDCGGARLVALVTRRPADALGLAPGRRVAAAVKAPAVRIVPRAAVPLAAEIGLGGGLWRGPPRCHSGHFDREPHSRPSARPRHEVETARPGKRMASR